MLYIRIIITEFRLIEHRKSRKADVLISDWYFRDYLILKWFSVIMSFFLYRCRHPGCQKAFSQLSNLQSHSRCHQTDKPYKCNSCYKCFSDEPSLLEHIPKHKESKHLKTHICQYCGKSYTQETYLQKHMQKHAERTDKRPPIGPGIGKKYIFLLKLVNVWDFNNILSMPF